MAKLLVAPTKNGIQKTLAAQLLSTATTGDPITFDDVDGIPNLPGVLVINRVNASNESTPAAREYIEYSGTSGTTVLITTRNVDSSNSALTHAVGSIVEFIPDVTWADRIYDALANVVDVDTLAVDATKVATPASVASSSIVLSGSNYFSASGATISTIKDEDTLVSDSATALATQQSIKAYVDGKKATGAEVTTGTEDAKYATPKALADAGVNTRLKSKVITATRDLTAASGNVAYTGVGFTPTSIMAVAGIDGTTVSSVGFSDSSKASSNLSAIFGGQYYSPVHAGALIDLAVTAGSNDQYATVATYDADGFTLTWTKANSPTGTAKISFICYR